MLPISPQKIRELSVQMLYRIEQTKTEVDDLLLLLQELVQLPEELLPRLKQRHIEIVSKQNTIDQLITEYSLEFSFDRIQLIEKAILRQAIFELLFDSTVNEKIVIAEAIRLCKKFSSHEAIPFVNGILDAIYQKLKSSEKLS